MGNLRGKVLAANSALEVLEVCGAKLAQRVSEEAKAQADQVLAGAATLDVIIVDRACQIIAHAT